MWWWVMSPPSFPMYQIAVNMVYKKAQLPQGLRATAVRVYRHLGFLKFESCTISPVDPKTPPENQIARRSANRLLSYGHFCISKIAISRHLGFYRIGNSAIRSAFPENPSLEPNMEWIGCTVFEIWRHIGPKSTKKPTPLSFGTFLWGDPVRIFLRLIPCQKLESWGYQMVYNSRSCFRSAKHNTGVWQTDGQTDGQTRRCRKDAL